MTWQHKHSPGELLILMGRIHDPKLNELCSHDKRVRRWAAREFKKIGGVYSAGHAHLYGCWSFGLPDLHWHRSDAKLGGTGQSPEEAYRDLLGEASDLLVKQSLTHETALMMSGAPNWVTLVKAEVSKRANGKGA